MGLFKCREKNSSSHPKRTSLSSADRLAQSISFSGVVRAPNRLTGGGADAGTSSSSGSGCRNRESTGALTGGGGGVDDDVEGREGRVARTIGGGPDAAALGRTMGGGPGRGLGLCAGDPAEGPLLCGGGAKLGCGVGLVNLLARGGGGGGGFFEYGSQFVFFSGTLVVVS
jgi:hypothetical protein